MYSDNHTRLYCTATQLDLDIITLSNVCALEKKTLGCYLKPEQISKVGTRRVLFVLVYLPDDGTAHFLFYLFIYIKYIYVLKKKMSKKILHFL